MSRPEAPDAGFLSRWARRKQEAAAGVVEPGPAEAAPPQTAPHVPAATRGPTDTDKAKETEVALPLPSLDDIVPGGDVSVFLQKHVPDALRNAALRKAWASDPEISGFIEMADYQWDFANPDSIPGWSSKLEGIDLQAMVERIFAAPPLRQEEIAPPEGQIATATSETIPAASGPDVPDEITDNSGNSETSLAPQPHDEMASIQNGAAQNNTKESSVYDVGRKRHGGALPT